MASNNLLLAIYKYKSLFFFHNKEFLFETIEFANDRNDEYNMGQSCETYNVRRDEWVVTRNNLCWPISFTYDEVTGRCNANN